MYLKRIVLENIRGFDSLDFALQRPNDAYAGWTVFTGDNGSGKSTLLKAIAVALAGVRNARALQSSFRGWIRVGCADAVIALEVVPTDVDDHFRGGGGRTSPSPFWAEVGLSGSNGDEPLIEPSKKFTRKGKTATRGPWCEQPGGWFACGYGPFRRIQGTSPDAQRLMMGAGYVGRFVTLFREDASLAECDQWLRELRFRETEGDDSAGQKLRLVKGFLDDELLQNGMQVERVDPDGLWLRDRSGVVLPLDDMSDGYRAALALIADVLRQLMDVYGAENVCDMQNGRQVVKKSGVVLIDEIDAHLHPEWQRKIGFWLKEHLPRMQFLVTSHSPLICQSADPNGLFHLPAPGSGKFPSRISDLDYQQIIAAKPDTILLSPAFGLTNTRSPLAVKNRARYADLQARKKGGVTLTPEEIRQEQLLLPFTTEK